MKKLPRFLFYITLFALFLGLILSIASLLGICTERCAKGHDWRLLGLPFEYIGIAFFSTAILVLFLSRRFRFFTPLLGLMLAGTLGSEAMFIYIQKYWIHAFCPLCLWIAFSVFVAFLAFFIPFIGPLISRLKQGNRREKMISSGKLFITLGAFLFGFMTAALGVKQINSLEGAESSIKEALVFGDKSSQFEVYLFTDWACTGCRALEPRLKTLHSLITAQAKFFYIDYEIHPETLNFLPYNVSFLIKNKSRYLALRDMLTRLSEKTGEPSEEQVKEGATALGTFYDPLPYGQIDAASRFFKKMAERFNINFTPTLVIVDTKTKKGKKLEGADSITEEAITEAFDSLRRE